MPTVAPYAPSRRCAVYTPGHLAEAMVNAVSKTHRLGATWLEPSVGGGVFLSVLNSLGVKRENIFAVDLSKTPNANDILATTTRGVDFLAWASATLDRFDFVVGNPPYVPFDELPQRALSIARKVRFGPENVGLGGKANLWAAFVAASVPLLHKGGSLCLLLPAGWDYANYAEQLRSWVPSQFREFTVIRSKRPLFPSVEEGSVVIMGKGYGERHTRSRRIECEDIDALITQLVTGDTADSLHPSALLINEPRGNGRSFKDVASIRIGAVTGDNDFFILSEYQRKTLGLPTSSCVRSLTRSRHLTEGFITSDAWEKLKDAGERVWLFRPSTEAAQKDPNVKRYLRLNEQQGGCRRSRFKITNRKPWYITPLPETAHGFISGMCDMGPWISFNQARELTASNTLYLVNFSPDLTQADRISTALGLLSSSVRTQVESLVRRYPGGLRKLEPSDLAELLLPIAPASITEVQAETAYRHALRHLLEGNAKAAQDVADLFFHA